MARVLVTGSAGFIGCHVAQALLAEGHDVVGVDSFNTYYPVELKERRHGLLTPGLRFRGVRLDLALRDESVALVRDGGFDVVCHLAAQAGVRYSVQNPQAYVDANLVAFMNVLEGCRHAPERPRLVYASSSSVYGGAPPQPFVEDQPVDHPISLYAATKKANELMAHVYTHLFGVRTVGLRFFTVCGAWGRPDMMLWKFTEAIHFGLPVPLYNGGDQRRSFTDVRDIVAGVRAALFAPGLAPYEVLNLGNDRSEQLETVVSTLERCIGRPARRTMLPAQPGDVQATWADVSRARALLGFEPGTPLERCVEDFVAWYQAQPELADLVRRWRETSSS